ncbi:hypothetical protein EYF80_013755 [Liparis tanakae]|uniref:Uncharacterized protein n=1 Tax=Liparis tanakae TaxID=230148 RepID=A0A4Z2IF95_9TELE|nr:hypothetical protein EYF80_013755 [Liparis tanakae]
MRTERADSPVKPQPAAAAAAAASLFRNKVLISTGEQKRLSKATVIMSPGFMKPIGYRQGVGLQQRTVVVTHVHIWASLMLSDSRGIRAESRGFDVTETGIQDNNITRDTQSNQKYGQMDNVSSSVFSGWNENLPDRRFVMDADHVLTLHHSQRWTGPRSPTPVGDAGESPARSAEGAPVGLDSGRDP